MNQLFCRIIASVLLLVTPLLVRAAEGQIAREPTRTEKTPCPQTQATLDLVSHKAQSGRVFAIARLGEGESSPTLSERRLYNVREYLTGHGRRRGRISDEQLITALGPRTRGLGRVDLYANGEYVGSLFASPKRDLQVAECETLSHPWFYPARKAKPPAAYRIVNQ